MDVKPLVALARKDTNFVGSNPTTNSSYINSMKKIIEEIDFLWKGDKNSLITMWLSILLAIGIHICKFLSRTIGDSQYSGLYSIAICPLLFIQVQIWSTSNSEFICRPYSIVS